MDKYLRLKVQVATSVACSEWALIADANSLETQQSVWTLCLLIILIITIIITVILTLMILISRQEPIITAVLCAVKGIFAILIPCKLGVKQMQ